MQHSQVSPNARQQLAETVVLNKARLGLSWQDLADGTGLALTFVTAALLGQHALPEAAARKVAAQLGLDDDAVLLLQSIPLRGSIPGGIPSDPTIYRFYEMLQVYGSTLKALVHEQFGDGIISAINFKLDIKKVEDPEGGSRAVITLDQPAIQPGALAAFGRTSGENRRGVETRTLATFQQALPSVGRGDPHPRLEHHHPRAGTVIADLEAGSLRLDLAAPGVDDERPRRIPCHVNQQAPLA